MTELLAFAGMVTALAAAWAVMARIIGKVNAVIEGIRCQLRTDMMRVYYRCREAKAIRQYEKENFEHNFSAYKALGGNSFIDDIHAQVRKWDVET